MSTADWNRRVWRLAGPIILSNISVPLLGAVDTAVVGHLPDARYLGAVAVGAMIFNLLFLAFTFMRMSITGLAAQALGTGDADEVRACMARSLILALALGGGLLLLQRPLGWGALTLVAASVDVEPLAEAYFAIRIWAAPAVLANFAILGWFIGIRNTCAALIHQLAMNGVNIVLDLWFVLGLGLGVEGVAAATLISELGAAALGLWLVGLNTRRIGGRWRRDLAFDGARFWRLAAINGDIFIRSLCLQAAFALFTVMGARMGDTVLAANAVLMTFQSFISNGLDGFAHAASALAGAAISAGSRRQLRGAVLATSLWALAFALFFTLGFAFFGSSFINLFTDIAEVRATALAYLLWIMLSPLISVWSFQLDGIFVGATRTAEMRNAMIASLAVYGAALAILVPPFGNHGLWAALMVLMAARTATLAMYYPGIEVSAGD